jgi:hypothetical protein
LQPILPKPDRLLAKAEGPELTSKYWHRAQSWAHLFPLLKRRPSH